MSEALLALLRRFAVFADRKEAMAELAARCGAQAGFVFVPHPDDVTKHLPAAGCASTVPARRGWTELLEQARVPGEYTGSVTFPTAAKTTPAVAYAQRGLVIVLVGHGEIQADVVDVLGRIGPLLAALLRAERDANMARGELAVATQSVERAETLAKALDIARSEALQATRAKDEFLAMLGHELRNPLAPIVTALQVLRLEKTPVRVQDILERQVGHLLRLVDDLLDVSRITRGKIELRKECIEIGVIVTRAVEMARPLLEQKRNDLVISVPGRGLTVDGDPARLAQVLQNLVTNASKYSDAGTQIRITAERRAQTVRVTVEDRGIGIEPHMLERIFERFMQVPQGIDRAAGGLGLGLAIVRSLVAVHGGRVTVCSDGIPGHGSAFSVELPYYDAPAEPRPVTDVALPVQPARAARILVVDDNRDAAELLAECLETFCYEVVVVHDGPTALSRIAEWKPDIGLLDIGLPVMDGYELAGRLREELSASVRLVAITGYGQASDRARASRAGFDAHLTKPVSLAHVQETIIRLLDR